MHAVEDRMWWYRGLHANLLTTLRRHATLGDGAAILDAGCGTGRFLKLLREAYPHATLLGIDLDPVAAELAREKSGAAVTVGSIAALPIANGQVSAIVSADVLYHQAVDETAALAEFHRCLAPDGVLLLNLPAYEWLRSAHDRAVEGARRYTASGIAAKLRRAGFRQVQAGYWNTFLFPLMVLRRKFLATAGDASDVMLYPAPVEFLFRSVMHVEQKVLERGGRLPFGGSVLVAAVK